MSLEFKRKKSHSTKWSKKYPRARINNKGGDRKAAIAAEWYKFNWNDDHFNSFNSKLVIKFLKANVGRPIDKVFSEFLDKCDSKLRKSYPLKEEFYNMFEEKEDIGYWGGFYLTNGIINYKKRRKPPYRKFPVSISDLNRKLIPENLKEICERCEETHRKQYLGKFWIDYKTFQEIYVIERKVWGEWDYDSNIFKLTQHCKRCYLCGVGSGIYKQSWASQSKLHPRVTYKIADAYMLIDKPDIIFITKINPDKQM